MIELLVNGKHHTVPANHTLLQLLETLNLPTLGVAVAVNSDIVLASNYDETKLREGDKIEIIRAVGGG